MRVRLLFFIAAIGVASCKTAGEEDELKRQDSAVVGSGYGYVYKVYFKVSTFEVASKSCASKSGRLVTITDKATDASIASVLFEVSRGHGWYSDDVNSFWMGLHWKDGNWQFEGKTRRSWQGENKHQNFKEEPTPNEDNKHCVAFNLEKDASPLWEAEACAEYKPYICMEPGTVCLPPGATSDSHKPHTVGASCNAFKGDKFIKDYNCNCGGEDSIPVRQNITMCNSTHAWDQFVCVPVCRADYRQTPRNALLLQVDSKVYYSGSNVQYYCPGYFTFKGNVKGHTMTIPCQNTEDFEKTIGQLQCQQEDKRHKSDELVDPKRIVVHAVTDHEYALRCDYKGFPDVKVGYVWYRNGKKVGGDLGQGSTKYVLDKNDNNLLLVNHLTDDGTGLYKCYGLKYGYFLEGNAYNVTLEHYKGAEHALKSWNKVDEVYLGEFVDGTVYNHVAYLDRKFTYDEAAEQCGKKGLYGHLAKLSTNDSVELLTELYSLEMFPSFRLKSDSRSTYPTNFWVGLKQNVRNEWMTHQDRAPSTLPWDTEHRSFNDKELHCAVVFLPSNGEPKLRRVSCNSKHHYICSYPSKICAPKDVDDGARKSNFFCEPQQLNNNTLFDNSACVCDGDDEEDKAIRNSMSCSATKKWNTSVCVQKCEANKDYGKLVLPEGDYYTGMYMTYFCAGHFEVNGLTYNEHSLQLMCNATRDSADEGQVSIQCKKGRAVENYAVHVIELDERKKDYDLECPFHQHSKVDDVIWLHDGELIDVGDDDDDDEDENGFRGNTLKIRYKNVKDLGMYMCFLEFQDVLVPGAVHMLVNEKTASKEVDQRASAGHSFKFEQAPHLLPLFLLAFLLR